MSVIDEDVRLDNVIESVEVSSNELIKADGVKCCSKRNVGQIVLLSLP